jgi:hypothetical protein
VRTLARQDTRLGCDVRRPRRSLNQRLDPEGSGRLVATVVGTAYAFSLLASVLDRCERSVAEIAAVATVEFPEP